MSARDTITVKAARELIATLTAYADGAAFERDQLHALRNQLTFVRVCVRDELEAAAQLADAQASR